MILETRNVSPLSHVALWLLLGTPDINPLFQRLIRSHKFVFMDTDEIAGGYRVDRYVCVLCGNGISCCWESGHFHLPKATLSRCIGGSPN